MSVTLHTSVGDLPFVLHWRSCPRAAFNFLALAASGYYNGTTFHRNLAGFIAQGGDPTGTGKGGSSVYSHYRQQKKSVSADGATAGSSGSVAYFDDEGFGETFHSRRGVLSMAHRGTKPNTNASQFFVTYAPVPSFDGSYTAFGELQGGDAILDALEQCSKDQIVVKLLDCTVTYNPFAEKTIPFDPQSV
ncbi:cyclophilin type peptidyl-prolyl cis-trans isomerase, putative [Bodo saltans]|uniref:Peptidyl-prolyl cis-trans isomerase n=1 Tax=Bodo saltans TaxID=75058 RepID=A0A0S4KDV3_BODSA|nr:cyclophilin type peptidyl-prolyl cis-trans isomerase, putative [Bodo saltans]|eukprot:CUI11163.1 cyclophilin type peptidyl-prolyl cis-trans isomerase, putative [Bodo saltans]